jgi:type IV pilus assembly protein PilV
MLTQAPTGFFRGFHRYSGSSLLEILITLVILVFGVIAIAKFQTKVATVEYESYQREQANLLLQDMSERLYANRATAQSYALTAPAGTGDEQPASCDGLAMGAARDVCEWSNQLKGAAEKTGSSNVGGIIGARGCISVVQAPNPADGVCTPGIYQITVAWQGLHATHTANNTCATGLYGDESYRRTSSTKVVVGLPTCL